LKEKRNTGQTGLANLMWAQAQVVFNDNAAKLSLIGMANLFMTGQRVDVITNLCAGLLVLPFILFSPVCGWITDRFSKTIVLRNALLMQVAAMLWIICSLLLHSLTGGIIGFFLLALQATFFSPAKQGILKELVGSERLNQAASLMEASTIVAILLGSLGGGFLLDYFIGLTGDRWTGGTVDMVVLTGFCIGSWLLILPIPRQAPQMSEPFRRALFWEHFLELRRLGRQPNLLGAALGSAWFYSLGGLFYLIIIKVGRLEHAQVGATTSSGILLALIGIGIVAGATLYATIAKSRVTLRFMPVCSILMTVSLWLLASVSPTGKLFGLGLFTLGLSGGMFVVPLNAYLQDRSRPEERGRVLAATNLIINVGGLMAVAIQFILADIFDCSLSHQILITAAANLLITLVVIYIHGYFFLQAILQLFCRCLYRVQLVGTSKIPEKGGVLLLCNHVSYVDAFLVPVFCPRRVRFLAYGALFNVPLLGPIMRAFGAIPISPVRAREAMRLATEYLMKGEVVCMFPEGELTRTGTIMGFKRGFELISRKAKIPIVPVHLDSLWGSIFSFSGGKYFWKWPAELPRRVRISFGDPLDSTVKAEEVRQQVLKLGVEAFRDRPELQRSLGATALERLSRTSKDVFMIDCTGTPQITTCGEILAASLVLSKHWRRTLHGNRIGIALPPGRGGIVANLAAVFAGKTPVNLNVTASREAIEASLRTGGIKNLVSAAAVKSMFPKFPWSDQMIDIGKEINSLSKSELLVAMLSIKLLPTWLLRGMFDISWKGGDREALLLFTSGSSGDPKGVVLTHRNVQANVAQVGAIELFNKSDRILGCLPLFHCFGSSFTLWLPLLREVGLVTTPSPTDAKRVGEAALAGGATILLGTPTFFRTYARKVTPEQFARVRLAVAGAEKLSPDLIQLYREKYKIEIMEGYGLTETSPVLSVNVPNPIMGPAAESQQIGNSQGSVGRLLPGVAYQLVNPETGELKSPGETGLLKVSGANVFQGYLGDPNRSAEALTDGWFNTGDLARVDEQGFLYIEGRLSRFAKIGGEMVPLVKVEEEVIKVLELPDTEGVPVVVMSVPHPVKGESLVLISSYSVELSELRKKLLAAGLTNLWIPKAIHIADRIPVLGTGKIDLKACKEMAMTTINEEKIEVNVVP